MRRPAFATMSLGARVLYASRCLDRVGSASARAASRIEHLEWIAALGERVRFAGPLSGEDGAGPKGSLVIVSGESGMEEVEQLLGADPYVAAGVFGSVERKAWVEGMRSDGGDAVMYVVWCVDKPDMKDVRMETRPQHLDWWRGARRKGFIGPFPDVSGEGATGSLLVCQGESIEEVREWAKNDPYNIVGLFETVDVYQVKKVFEDGRLCESVSVSAK